MRYAVSTGLLALAIGVMFAIAVPFGGPATAQNKKQAKTLRYLHKLHKANGVDQTDCKKCHDLQRDYSVKPPTAGNPHQPCADSECHGDQFFSTKPEICVVCHTDNKPWVKQTARQNQHTRSEFGSDLSHKTHATGRVKASGPGPNGVCKTCHGNMFTSANSERTKNAGHGACSACHARTNKPVMTDCGGCHTLGGKKGGVSKKGGDWAVGELFAHNTHGRDPRKPGTESTCVECHADITKATNLASIKNPTMRSCDGCHNGEHAFKTTGFQCYRCHAETAGAAGVQTSKAARR